VQAAPGQPTRSNGATRTEDDTSAPAARTPSPPTSLSLTMSDNAGAEARCLHRLHVELDVTPIWWAGNWVLDAPDILGALQKFSRAVLHRITAVHLQAEGVAIVFEATSTSTFADVERERLKLWQEFNALAKGHSARLVILSQARNALRDQLSALQTGVLAKPVPIPPNAPPGLARLLAGASSVIVKPKGPIWTPGAAAAP